MRAEYGWAPDKAWLDRVQAAAVRLTGGCSASFVSGEGLILTNHHCVASCVFENSTGENDILDKGFTADRREAELKCAGQQAEVVTKIADVTDAVKGAFAGLEGEALTRNIRSSIGETLANNIVAYRRNPGCGSACTSVKFFEFIRSSTISSCIRRMRPDP